MKENLVFSPNGQASIVVDAKTAKAAIELGLVRPNGDSLFASSGRSSRRFIRLVDQKCVDGSSGCVGFRLRTS